MKILIIAGLDSSLLNFRAPLLRRLVELGHHVIAAAPSETAGVPERLKAIGVDYEPTKLRRAGLNPILDLLDVFRLYQMLRRRQPDLVLSYTIKPIIYGSIAARFVGVSRIYALVTGLGSVFYASNFRGRIVRCMALYLYRLTLRWCVKVLVQNRDIADFFVRNNVVEAEQISVVHGSGVDVEHFTPAPLQDGEPTFLYIGRMLADKGVRELVSAARIVKEHLPHARILLVGDVDSNPTSLSVDQMNAWGRDGAIEWVGLKADVRPFLQKCTALVLPSYHEGLPRSILEAMAVGRPVITTDAVGCRETIISPGCPDSEGIRVGENGLLIPVRSIEPLAKAMLRLARDASLCARLGGRARQIAEERFDVHRINDQMVAEMKLAPLRSYSTYSKQD